ncbi:MAG: hypothetical protein AABY22_21040 [Nanoarchaeota archaeon]
MTTENICKNCEHKHMIPLKCATVLKTRTISESDSIQIVVCSCKKFEAE